MKPDSNLLLLEFLIPKYYALRDNIKNSECILQQNIQDFLAALTRCESITADSVKLEMERYAIDKKQLIATISYIKNIIHESHLPPADFFHKMTLENFFENKSESYEYFKDQLKKSIRFDIMYYPELFIYENHLEYLSVFNKTKQDKYESVFRSKKLIGHFLYCNINLMNFYLIEGQKYKIPSEHFLKEIENLRQIRAMYEINQIEIDIFFTVSELLIQNNKSYFDEILVLINSTTLKIKPININRIYTFLINSLYLNHKNWGVPISEILNVYKVMYLNNKQLFFDYLQPQILKNVATLCIRYGQLEWFYKVFNSQNMKNQSEENYKMLELCKAKISFHDQDYPKCISILNTHKFSDIFQELEHRRLQVMCFYELKERVLVDNYLNTFKIFIYRNETINVIYKESNNNFSRFLNRLNKTVDIKKVYGILNEINDSERVAEKQWLIDKIKELQIKLNEKK